MASKDIVLRDAPIAFIQKDAFKGVKLKKLVVKRNDENDKDDMKMKEKVARLKDKIDLHEYEKKMWVEEKKVFLTENDELR